MHQLQLILHLQLSRTAKLSYKLHRFYIKQVALKCLPIKSIVVKQTQIESKEKKNLRCIIHCFIKQIRNFD